MNDVNDDRQPDQPRPAAVRARLLAEKERLSRQAEEIDRALAISERESTQELSTYDNHPADTGSNLYEREKDLGLKGNIHRTIEKIEDALARLDEGRYGICDVCGRPIGRARLEAVPYTTVCFPCKERQEEFADRNPRPVEEDVLGYPFGRSFRDDTDEIDFDGEDTWQEVARYGTASGPQDEPDGVDYQHTYRDSDEELGIVEEIEGMVDDKGELVQSAVRRWDWRRRRGRGRDGRDGEG